MGVASLLTLHFWKALIKVFDRFAQIRDKIFIMNDKEKDKENNDVYWIVKSLFLADLNFFVHS